MCTCHCYAMPVSVQVLNSHLPVVVIIVVGITVVGSVTFVPAEVEDYVSFCRS
jgi:hypothetical protein